MELYNIRKKCIFCESTSLKTLLENDIKTPLGCYSVDYEKECYFIPYNILLCEKCKTCQTKYMGNLEIIYNYNAGYYGTIRGSMNHLFANFILKNKNNISQIIEIGGSSGELANIITKHHKVKYTVIDPTYYGNNNTIANIKEYFENVKIDKLNADTVVMSHVFEHFYNPLDIIQKFISLDIKNIFINFPDLDAYILQNTYHVLNIEHIYYVENEFLIKLFNKFGYDLIDIYYHENHSVFFNFQQKRKHILENNISNLNTEKNTLKFLESIKTKIDTVHEKINKLKQEYKDIKIYMFPSSMNTIYFCSLGFDHTLLSGVLDNSPQKIDKYLYGYKLKCFSLKEILSNKNENIAVILNGGCYNKEIDISAISSNIKIIYI